MTILVMTHEMGFMDEGRGIEADSPGEIFDRSQNPRAPAFLSKIL
jgi:ABC-type polar amino acid transport system ATPase subunit